MKVSIVVSYYDRWPQFMASLASWDQSSAVGDTELIVVDDNSPEPLKIEEVRKLYRGHVEVIRVEKQDKWYRNPCVPMNMGISRARGDLILLQNPETLHTGDVLADIVSHTYLPEEFRSYACYSLDKDTAESIKVGDSYHEIQAKIGPLRDIGHSAEEGRENVWFNHSEHRPVMLHFATVMTRGLLRTLNGFDEQFAGGLCKDDVEIVERARLTGCPMTIVDAPFVAHQWHPQVYNKAPKARRHNVKIFNRLLLSGFTVRANPDKEIVT
jgi:GT2 family glycosyltransferase